MTKNQFFFVCVVGGFGSLHHSVLWPKTLLCISCFFFSSYLSSPLYVVVVVLSFSRMLFLACAQHKKSSSRFILYILYYLPSWVCLAHTLSLAYYTDHNLFGACFISFGIFALYKLRVTYKRKPIGRGLLGLYSRERGGGGVGGLKIYIFYGSQLLIGKWGFSSFF